MDSTGARNGKPNPGANIHELILSEPSLKFITAYNSIGNNPMRIRRDTLFPGCLIKNMKR